LVRRNANGPGSLPGLHYCSVKRLSDIQDMSVS
jgi:hypothetical protein